MIVRFYAYRIMSRLYFHVIIIFMYFTALEYGLVRTMLLIAAYGFSITLASGVVRYNAQFLSARGMVLTGEVAKLSGIILLILGTQQTSVSFWLPLIGQILGGIGFCYSISSDIGLLSQANAKISQEDFARVQTKSQSLMFIATLVSGLAGAILYNYQYQWPFLATLVTNVAAILVVLSFPSTSTEPQARHNVSADRGAKPRLSGSVKFWMTYYVVGRIATLAPFIGFLPFFFIQLQPDPYTFGIVLSFFSLSAFVSAYYANHLDRLLGSNGYYWLNVVVMLCGMVLFTLCEWLAEHYRDPFPAACLATLLIGFGSGCIRPLSMSKLQLSAKQTDERTYIISTMEKRFGLFNSIVLIVGGGLIYIGSFSLVMLALTTLYFVTSVCRNTTSAQ